MTGWTRQAALGLAIAVLAGASPAVAKTYGLVVGIDDYAHVHDLAGARNDALDLAETLRARGAEVTLLLDREATRERILGEWSAIAGKVGRGDSVVFTYAGHGVQMPEALPGDERDGKDETFILHGFETNGPGLAERIRDNDVAEMLREIPSDVPVLLVADSCHSGTMTRSVDPRGDLGPTRYVEVGAVTAPDPLPKPSAWTRSLEPPDFPNVIVAYAARDDQETPEIRIDGVYRGALSWSVARALAGGAGRGRESLRLSDFQDFVVEQVRALSGARQTPGVRYSRSVEGIVGSEDLNVVLGAASASAAPPPAPELALAAPPTLYIRGKDTRAVFLGGIELAATEETARLLWDRPRGELVDRETADAIAEVQDVADVERAVLKWRAVQPLLRWAPTRPLAFRLEPDDRRYRLGEELWITVTQPDPDFSFLTIVNLASTGELQFIFPTPEHSRAGLDRIPPGQATKRLGPAPVTLPTGADHVVALASRVRLVDLHAALGRLNGRPAPEALLDLLGAHAADPHEVRVGVLPIFTER